MTTMELWKDGYMLHRFCLDQRDDISDLAKYLTQNDNELSVRLLSDEWVRSNEESE